MNEFLIIYWIVAVVALYLFRWIQGGKHQKSAPVDEKNEPRFMSHST